MDISKTQLKLLGLRSIAIAIGLTLISPTASAQATSPSQRPPLRMPQPVPLNHLYWHFLVYQNTLDTRAAEEQAQGKNGAPLRNSLQSMVGFSDADYAPIQAASTQLASELQPLNTQAATIRSEGPSSTTAARLKQLAAQREAYINAEILSLKEALPPAEIKALETFITQFFAPKQLTFKLTSH